MCGRRCPKGMLWFVVSDFPADFAHSSTQIVLKMRISKYLCLQFKEACCWWAWSSESQQEWNHHCSITQSRIQKVVNFFLFFMQTSFGCIRGQKNGTGRKLVESPSGWKEKWWAILMTMILKDEDCWLHWIKIEVSWVKWCCKRDVCLHLVCEDRFHKKWCFGKNNVGLFLQKMCQKP